jgi:two-component system sensor histidine kinase KdpD
VTVRLAPVALDEVVARALLRERRGHVVVDVAEDLPPVLADATLLERVVENLVENAVRFSPEGTKVEVTAELAPAVEAHDRGAAPSRALLHVVDHGPGIPPEGRTEMFTAFRRLDDRGPGPHVGLGLSIVQGFTEAMGITVEPSTTPGGGLTMTLTLPVVRS